MLRAALAVTILLPTISFAQSNPAEPTPQQPKREWARSPKEIAFQNDSQWEDNRWQKTDVGPFLANSIKTGPATTLKGIAIRVGDKGQAAVCFDTARLRLSAAWTGRFLNFESRRFGLIRHPSSAGQLVWTTPKIAGWAWQDRFQPEPAEITHVDVEQGYTAPGSSVVHLPHHWARYHGFYPAGERVVLSYSVGSTQVLESPWYVEAEGQSAFVRSFEIKPSAEPLKLWVADAKSRIALIGSASLAQLEQKRPVLVIKPHREVLRLKLLIAPPDTTDIQLDSLRTAAGPAENLSKLSESDSGRWPQVLTTTGTTTETGGPYVIDTLTLPFENPHRALFFTAGHDFFSNGMAAICTAHGDVWTVSGIDRTLKQLRWRRFATGLYQPLGLKIVDDVVYVIGREQITRLHDRNQDGEADFYENFNNSLFVCPRTHDYVTCLDTDPAGNFYFIHAKTGVMKVSRDGSQIESIADGFRNPNGMAVSPTGLITAAPQQGSWTPESSLIVVKPGGYYGYGGPRVTPERPLGWDPPMCFIPRAMDNSGGAQVWVDSDRWGPLQGQMLHLSYGQCRMLLALTEEVDGVYQGGTIKFPTTPADFESGIMRGRFNPHDGQLYVSGLRGWQTRSVRDGCFQRVRYTGGAVRIPTGVKTFSNGIRLTFSDPLDPKLAENVDNFLVEQWNYVWSSAYGSPDFSVAEPQRQGRDEVDVVSATLSDDGHSLFLEMPDRQPVMQIAISWLLSTRDGVRFRGTYAHTINTPPRQAFPEDAIRRRARPRRISQEVEQRLQPGLASRIQSTKTGATDLRVVRLAALRQPHSASATPFLPAGSATYQLQGTLKTQLSGFFEFKLQANGPARFWINNEQILTLEDSSAGSESITAEPILLHKNHNLVRIAYTSPATQPARLNLLWKGYDFDWEPVPPSVFFHDSGSPQLAAAQQRRWGRELFADHHCHRCHQTLSKQPAMLELSLAPPDLAHSGDRFHSAWLQQWILAPHRLRPSTRMPAMLTHSPTAQQDAADIAAYLVSLKSSQTVQVQTDTPKANRSQNGDGAALYEHLSCLSCHHFQSPGADSEWNRLSLKFVDAKFRPGALQRFLKAPTVHHKATRMPDFQLTTDEAHSLARFLRMQPQSKLPALPSTADRERGQRLFKQSGCASCHAVDPAASQQSRPRKWPSSIELAGCLAEDATRMPGMPDYQFNARERAALLQFVRADGRSLETSHPLETSQRLIAKLNCLKCHDRDGERAPRAFIMAEEGSGLAPEVIPALTWAGEKLKPAWTAALLAGELPHRSRPWLKARMPAFPAYASALAQGLAAEHGIEAGSTQPFTVDSDLVAVGEKLTLQTGLDCRQCHGIGDLQPRGDKNTKIALGINFSQIRDRLRYPAYHRFMLDPPRFDINTRMVKLSENGLSTKVKEHFDADAHQQFEAVWHYIQTVPPITAKD